MKLPLYALLLLPLITLPNTAMGQTIYKVGDFELYGVSLGDSAKEVTKGLVEYLSISADELDITKSSNGDAIEHIDFSNDEIEVNTYFEPNTDTNSFRAKIQAILNTTGVKKLEKTTD